MSGRIIIIAVLASLPTLVSAQAVTKYQCTYGELERRVEILTEPGVSVPCEVHYFKDTEAPGALEVPWNAQNQAGYCEARAEELVTSLRGWGWSCAVTGAAGTVRDDTDALSAGEAP